VGRKNEVREEKNEPEPPSAGASAAAMVDRKGGWGSGADSRSGCGREGAEGQKSRSSTAGPRDISADFWRNGLIILLPSMSVPSDWRSSLSAIRDYIQQQI